MWWTTGQGPEVRPVVVVSRCCEGDQWRGQWCGLNVKACCEW